MTDGQPDRLATTAWESEESGQSFPLLDYVQLLWFRRRLILAITLFISVIGYIQANEIKNVYSAMSTMIIGVPESQVMDFKAVLSRSNSFGDVHSEIEVLRSRGLAAKVIERLNLLSDAEFNPALREAEKSSFDFLRYLDPRTWIPASWKQGLKEAMGVATERAPPLPLSTQEQEAQQDTKPMV